MPDPAPRAAPHSFEYGTDGPRAIVVGVDGSSSSLRAAAYAAGLARRQRSRLVAVYARQPPGAGSLASTVAPLTVAVQDAQSQIEAELRSALLHQARTWGIDAELIIRVGEPLRVLTCVAAEVCADAIVVGSSATVAHKLARSLGTRLVRRAPCPVTVVP